MATEKTLLLAEMNGACIDTNFYQVEYQGREFTWHYVTLDGDKVAKVYKTNVVEKGEFLGYTRTLGGIAQLIIDYTNDKW